LGIYRITLACNNVLGLCDGGEFKHPPQWIDAENQMFGYLLIFLRSNKPAIFSSGWLR
jgi:hypothetical protein